MVKASSIQVNDLKKKLTHDIQLSDRSDDSISRARTNSLVSIDKSQ